MRERITVIEGIEIEVGYDKKDPPHTYTGHVNFFEVSELTKPCPFCNEDTNKRELSNTHIIATIYEIECECGASMDGEYYSPEKVKTLKGYIECHKKAIQDVLDRWNWRSNH